MTGATPPDGCRLAVVGPNPGLACDVDGPCSVVHHTTCWTVRFACFWIGEPLERQLGWECETQPGCCNSTEGSCNNYGVQVVVNVWSGSICSQESCRNEGVLVAIGRYCDAGTRVCAGEVCLDACTATIIPVSRFEMDIMVACSADGQGAPLDGSTRAEIVWVASE
jgi:hypothetical protein